ncbi:hypothetical protein CEXT_201661 [Caerostris extrusa]|uniref:Uncharacterized protein n=1 Tax=Caerostris extrusa TaxID=172846 RepID=A0AAV4PRK1_CAEEX|nr:hypothetical protein CEXT_201661 [Caerostris extrusa]
MRLVTVLDMAECSGARRGVSADRTLRHIGAELGLGEFSTTEATMMPPELRPRPARCQRQALRAAGQRSLRSC